MQTPDSMMNSEEFHSQKHALAFLSHSVVVAEIKCQIFSIFLSCKLLIKNTFIYFCLAKEHVTTQHHQFGDLCSDPVFFFLIEPTLKAIHMQHIFKSEQKHYQRIILMLVAILSAMLSETKLCSLAHLCSYINPFTLVASNYKFKILGICYAFH